ncbi:hypothetical protein ACHJ0D_000833 [Campylobacter coli]
MTAQEIKEFCKNILLNFIPQSQATYAIAEGILIMFLSGLGEIKSKRS